MPTSKAQLDSVKRRKTKLRREGYAQIATHIDPDTKAALDYLRQNRPGGFNLTEAIQQMILTEATQSGFKPD
jgi:hypothetical protein